MLKFKKKNIVLGMFLMMLLFQPLKAEAAETMVFHEHAEGCHTTGPILCTDEVKVTTHAEEFNCATCGRIAAAHVVVETYSCKYISSERELRRIAYCYTCHSIVQNVEKGGQPKHYRNGQINVCGYGTDTVIAKVSLNSVNTEWTKETVILKAGVTEVTQGLSLAPYSYSFSGGIANGDSCEVSENGLYSVQVTGNNGQTTTVSLQVSNIDKKLPGIQKIYVDKEYPEYDSATLIVEAADDESGLAEQAYSFDGGASYGDINQIKITSNGTYTLYVRDKAGNIATGTYTVNCFAKRPVTVAGNTTNAAPPVSVENEKSVETSVKAEKDYSKEKADKKQETDTEDNELEKQLLKKQLEQSGAQVKLQDIPGIYSSVMKNNAEKNAVPMTLSVTTIPNEEVYATKQEMEENFVENMPLNEQNKKTDGNFAQVSKAVVGAGVLICIGMVGFLLVFLVKKQ